MIAIEEKIGYNEIRCSGKDGIDEKGKIFYFYRNFIVCWTK